LVISLLLHALADPQDQSQLGLCTVLVPCTYSDNDDRLGLLALQAAMPALATLWGNVNTYTVCTNLAGVTCEGLLVQDKKVTGIEITGAISGTIPTNINLFKYLTKFVVATGLTSGTIPDFRGVFPTATNSLLNLGSNYISGTIPTTLGAANINQLLLGDNLLNGTIPTELFSRTAGPKLLYLNDNLLSGTLPPHIGNTTSMTELRLDNNRLTGTLPTKIGLLESLSIFNVQVNQLSGPIPTVFGNLNSLRFFSVGSNQLNGTIPGNFPSSLSSIDIMLFTNNRFTGDVQQATLSNYASLLGLGLGVSRFLDFQLNRLNDRTKSGFSGLLAQTTINYYPQDKDECALGTSGCDQQFGYCLDGWSPLLSFTCACYSGYAFNTSGYCIDVNECTSGVPINCTVDKCINLPGTYECCGAGLQTAPNGTACEDIDECANGLSVSTPSSNGLSCGYSKCINTYANFTCCGNGYEAFNRSCRDIDECASGLSTTLDSVSGPLHCIATSCINAEGNFSCCGAGYESFGGTCRDIDECATGLSLTLTSSEGPAHCPSYGCQNTNGSFKCCDAGFESFDGICRDVDECSKGLSSSETGLNGTSCEEARCVNTNGSFFCCGSGYESLAGACQDVDECSRGTSISEISLNNTSCERVSCANTPGNFTCCQSGYEAFNGSTCRDIDECATGLASSQNGLNGTTCVSTRCVNTPGSFFCCGVGYESVNGTCRDINECVIGTSTSQNGLNGTTCPTARCINTPGSFFCCGSGYEVVSEVCRDIDECAVGTSTSQNGLNGTTCPTARCINTPGDFFCCGSGYEAVSGVCRDINECTLGTSTSQNGQNGTTCPTARCVNTPGSFFCCGGGYETINETCRDVDECSTGLSSSQPGVNGKCDQDKCINTPGNFTCCTSGFEAFNGSCRDIDECAAGTSTSQNGLNGTTCPTVRCINTNGSFFCCGSGFETVDSVCRDVDECATGLSTSVRSASGPANCPATSCVNTIGNFTCCQRGYESFDGACRDIDECASGTSTSTISLNGTSCDKVRCANTPGNFSCCLPGFEAFNGSTCRDIDECALGLSTSQVGSNGVKCPKERCLNSVGNFSCCSVGFESVNGTCRDIDECAVGTSTSQNGLNGTTCPTDRCMNTPGSFFCCGNGYEAVNGTCRDVDECARGTYAVINGQDGEKCNAKSVCVNTIGSFYCCQNGFQTSPSGTGCVDINECTEGGLWNTSVIFGLNGTHCNSSETCVNTNGSYFCCTRGFRSSGSSCVDINECTDPGEHWRDPGGYYGFNCTSDLQCANLYGSFSCCQAGYRAGATGCFDINECNDPGELWNVLIGLNGTKCPTFDKCVNVDESFFCCPDGYKSDGVRCVDINECTDPGTLWASSTNSLNGTGCNSSDKCVNGIGNFWCCNNGFFSTGLGCEDINECQKGLWTQNTSLNGTGCQKVEQCVNYPPGSFYCCAPGFEAAADGITCRDTDECAWGYQDSSRSVCPNARECINTYGGYFCCGQGNSSNGTACIDYDDCQDPAAATQCGPKRCVNIIGGTFYCCSPGELSNGTGCTNLNECADQKDMFPPNSLGCGTPFLCYDVPGSYNCCATGTWNPNPFDDNTTCVSCFGDWVLEEIDNSNQFQSLLPYYGTHKFDHQSCAGTCEAGFRLERRQIGFACQGFDATRKTNCSYPCKNLTLFNTARTAIRTLQNEFERGGFLENVFQVLFNSTIQFQTKKRDGQEFLNLLMEPCPDNFTAAIDLLYDFAVEITPEAPALQIISSPSQCTASISSTDPVPPNYLPIILGVVLGVFGLLMLLLLLGFLYTRILRGLPRGVSWSYQAYLTNPIGWTYRGTNKAGYYFKDLTPGSAMYNRANALFESFHEPTGKKLIIKKITAVYNPTLVTNFIGQYKIMTTRSTNPIFTKQPWLQQEGKEIKQWVYKQYVDFYKRFSWNDHIRVPIVPMLHGTDGGIAEKICETGFASLSSLDAGYFGKGIYFTSYGMYTLPYIASRNNPALILSYTLPGNVFPVTEDHQGPKSLVGAAIKNGYSSHFIVTNGKGSALDHVQNDEIYDEMVIPQESQITPAFIFLISNQNIRELAIAWEMANRPVAPEKPVKLIPASEEESD